MKAQKEKPIINILMTICFMIVCSGWSAPVLAKTKIIHWKGQNEYLEQNLLMSNHLAGLPPTKLFIWHF